MQLDLNEALETPIHERDKVFAQFLLSLQTTRNTIDETFLTGLSQALELKNVVEPQQVTQIVILLALATSQQDRPEVPLAVNVKAVEELRGVVGDGRPSRRSKGESKELVGWLSKIWDRLIHFSSVKNYLDLLALYFYVGDFLLEPEQELRRLTKLLVPSLGKIKALQGQALELADSLLENFLQQAESRKYIHELRVKLRVLRVLLLAKAGVWEEWVVRRLEEQLAAVYDGCLLSLIDLLQRAEENATAREYEILWDRLFAALLGILVKQPRLKKLARQLIVEMINYKIDVQTVKLLIRQLQVTPEDLPTTKWRDLFDIMGVALRLYDVPRDCLLFLNSKAFLKLPTESRDFMYEIELKCCLRPYREEKILFALQNKDRSQEMWVTMRNSTEGEAEIALTKVTKSVIWEKVTQEFKWQQTRPNTLIIQCGTQLKVSCKDTAASISMPRFIDIPSALVIGDQDGALSTPIRTIYSLSVYNGSRRDSGICLRLEVGDRINRGVRRKSLLSFIELVKAVGDLDIFLLIISHAMKKMKRKQEIVGMIRLAIDLLEQFVQIKRVKQQKLGVHEREERLNAILCLCWQCSHETQNALAILELLRVLGIRGVSSCEDELQILCNFVFWKNFEWQYQRLIIMKIKELFRLLHSQPNYPTLIHKYCKRILLETALYYREEDVTVSSNDYVLRIHHDFLALVNEELKDQLADRKEMELYCDFLEFLLKLMGWTLNRRDTSISVYDLTFSLELSFLARQLGEGLVEWSGRDDRMMRLIRSVIQVCQVYENEEKYYQEKKIRIFKGGQIYEEHPQVTIKQNLYFLAYAIASLKPPLLLSLVQIEDYGMAELACVVWQRQFFDKLILNCKEKQWIFETDLFKLQSIRSIYETLPLKSLSNEQNILLGKLFLQHDKFFPKADLKIAAHLCHMLSIKDLLAVLHSCLAGEHKIESEVTSESKLNESMSESARNEAGGDRINEKVMLILSIARELTCEEAMSVLAKLDMQPMEERTYKIKLLVSHFCLKGLVQRTKQLFYEAPSSSIFVQSLVEVNTRPSSSILQPEEEVLGRGEIVRCLQFYFSEVGSKEVNGWLSVSGEEGESHLQNLRINITSVMNLASSTEYSAVHKLKNYYHFLEKQLLPLSNHILESTGFGCKEEVARKRKKSKEIVSLPRFDFKEESKSMFVQFLEERNLNLLKVERVWTKVEEKNKYFWTTFIAKEVYYSLYDATGSLGQRYLLRKDTKKPKLQLPRMLKTSCLRSNSILSIISDRFDNDSVSSIFDDAPLYRKEPASCLSAHPSEPSKQGHRNNKFRVLMITSAKIYQGKVTVSHGKLAFNENEQIDDILYEKIFASECQKRTEDECIRQNFHFEVELNGKCFAIVKRYLCHDLAVELHTRSRSYLFSFIRRDHRQAFLYLLERDMKVYTREKLAEEVRSLGERWENGLISNYQYLMKLNDFTGRSLNDLSQYYVFPWTVNNFTSPMDAAFLNDPRNFRDLSLPVGKLSRDKWQPIKRRFESQKEARGQNLSMPMFLFGSFYSNRAIVCNLLIRVNPFTSQHYQLQSLQFDNADRLFFSLQDMYKSLITCSSDFKELIPEFYYFPEFLKNRSAYDLGLRQNKDIVHNVALPGWAQDEYEFVFRMRKALESGIVTGSLHQWIDLVFGVYAKKQNALKADNLFLGDLYIEAFEKYLCEKDKCAIQMFKEFGQVPVSLLNANHPPSRVPENHLDSIVHPSMRLQECNFAKLTDSGKLLQIVYYKRFTLILCEKQIRVYEEDKFGQKDCSSINGEFQGGSLRIWQTVDVQNKRRVCVLVWKRKTQQLCAYELKKNIWQRFYLDGGDTLPLRHRCEHFLTLESYLLCVEGRILHIYRNIPEEIDEEHSNKNGSVLFAAGKGKFQLAACKPFTQHRARILQMGGERGLVVSIDEEHQVCVMELQPAGAVQFNSFEIRAPFFEERVVEMLVHPMAFILLRTDYDRLLLYTFLGDLVLAQHLNFVRRNEEILERPIGLAFWNPELSELLIGTNVGNLWKIDLFQMRRHEVITEVEVWMERVRLSKQGFRRQSLLKMAVHRLGRHSLTLVYAQNHKLYILRSHKWDEARRSELVGKKVPNFW